MDAKVNTAPLFKLVSSITKPLTQEVLKEFVAIPKGPTERDLNKGRLKFLRERIEAGLAVPFNWAIVREGENVYRMNGQHSSAVLSELNGKFPNGLTVHLDEYEVAGRDSMIALFRQFDPARSARGPKDVSYVHQQYEPDLFDLDPVIAKKAVEAISYYDTFVEKITPLRGDEQYSLLHDRKSHPFLNWLPAVLTKQAKELDKKPVIAAMWSTHQANASASDVFWRLVAAGGEQGVERHPTTLLDDWLTAMHNRTLDYNVKVDETYNGCINVWNAWRKGETSMTRIKYDANKGAIPTLE